MKMNLDKIVIDESIYPRKAVSSFNVDRIVMAIRAGAVMPPLVLEAGSLRLVEGRHRFTAFRELEMKTAEVIQKTYASEADLFADAVRLNVGHGLSLDSYSIQNAIIRLTALGYAKEQISEVVRMPVDKLDKIERGFATNAETGEPVALKGGLRHLARQPLTNAQIETNRHYSGLKATFYVNQLVDLLSRDMQPRTEAFVLAMDDLVEAWKRARASIAA